MQSKYDWVRRGQRLIRMVSELHRMGYQRLRIMPWEHPLAWRLAICPADVFSQRNGAYSTSYGNTGAEYSSKDGNSYFGWSDAQGDSAHDLATKFVARFPDIAQRGLGRDWEYAGWLAELVGFLEQGDWLPVVEWEYIKGTPDDLTFLPILSAKGENFAWDQNTIPPLSAPSLEARHFPLPPAWIEADDDDEGESSFGVNNDPARYVRSRGKNLTRVREAIRCFRLEHSGWPTILGIGESVLETLKHQYLTPEGFSLLENRLVVIPQVKRELILLADNSHNEFDYSSDEIWGEDQSVQISDVDRWIWGTTLPS